MDGPLGKIAFDFFKGEEVFYKIEVCRYIFRLMLFVLSRNKFQVKMSGKKPYFLNWAKKPVPIYGEIR